MLFFLEPQFSRVSVILVQELRPREELNPGPNLRKVVFYPLNYGGVLLGGVEGF